MKLSALSLAALSATSIAFAPAVQAGEYDGYQTCAAYNHRAETPDDRCLVNGHMTTVGAFRAMTNAGPSTPGINDRQPQRVQPQQVDGSAAIARELRMLRHQAECQAISNRASYAGQMNAQLLVNGCF